MALVFPENFDFLHRGQEHIRELSKAEIAGSDVLLRHFNAVAESLTAIDHFAKAYDHAGEDELTIQLLGVRLFNSAAGAVQSLMGGYYQNAVMLQRDLLEVSFLLDYFRSNRDRIAEWRGCTESARNKNFSAFKIRTALDDRDGFTERKRAEHYALLCTLGAHASYQGFQLLQPNPGGDAHCGPYFSERALNAVVAELAKICVMAARNFTLIFETRSTADWEVGLQSHVGGRNRLQPDRRSRARHHFYQVQDVSRPTKATANSAGSRARPGLRTSRSWRARCARTLSASGRCRRGLPRRVR